MAENKKVVFSKSILKRALVKLLKEKSLDRIGVSELCKTAGVNRSTFYAHYETVQELLDEIEEEFLSKIPMLDISADEKQLISEINRYTSFIKEHPDAFLVLTRNNRITQKFYERWIQEQTVLTNDASGRIQEKIRLIGTFMTCGVTEAYNRWLCDGEFLSCDDLAKFILDV